MQITITVVPVGVMHYAYIKDDEFPEGPPLAEAYRWSPRAAVLALIDKIDITPEEDVALDGSARADVQLLTGFSAAKLVDLGGFGEEEY